MAAPLALQPIAYVTHIIIIIMNRLVSSLAILLKLLLESSFENTVPAGTVCDLRRR
jgi:hypothetical protein